MIFSGQVRIVKKWRALWSGELSHYLNLGSDPGSLVSDSPPHQKHKLNYLLIIFIRIYKQEKAV